MLLTSGGALGVDPTRLRVITTRRRDAAGNVSTVVVMPANPLNGYRFSCVLAPSATAASVVAAVSAHGLSTAQLAVSGGHVDLNVTAASSAFAEDLEYAFCLHNESSVCKLLLLSVLSMRCPCPWSTVLSPCRRDWSPAVRRGDCRRPAWPVGGRAIHAGPDRGRRSRCADFLGVDCDSGLG